MIRGQKNSFFMAVRDQNMETDAIIEVVVKVKDKSKNPQVL